MIREEEIEISVIFLLGREGLNIAPTFCGVNLVDDNFCVVFGFQISN